MVVYLFVYLLVRLTACLCVFIICKRPSPNCCAVSRVVCGPVCLLCCPCVQLSMIAKYTHERAQSTDGTVAQIRVIDVVPRECATEHDDDSVSHAD